MQSLLIPLHTLLSAVSLPIQCIALSTLFLGWLSGHLAMQYASMLHRPAPFAAGLGWLCGLPMTLLVIVLLVNTVVKHDYNAVRAFGLLALVMLLVSAFGQRACRSAAGHHLATAGHTDPQSNTVLARMPKSRGS